MEKTRWMLTFALLAALGVSIWAGVDADRTIEEMLTIIADGSALILDTGSYPEWAVGHIPGTLVVAPRPGESASQYVSDVAEVERLTGGDLEAEIVLLCIRSTCGKAERLRTDLLDIGFTNVHRFQLGAPMWRALGNPTVIEAAGIRHVVADPTAYWVDARDATNFAAASFVGVSNLANVTSGEVERAKDELRLPLSYDTRIVVFGADGDQARELAVELTGGAYHDVAYFEGGFDALMAAAHGVEVASPACTMDLDLHPRSEPSAAAC